MAAMMKQVAVLVVKPVTENCKMQLKELVLMEQLKIAEVVMPPVQVTQAQELLPKQLSKKTPNADQSLS